MVLTGEAAAKHAAYMKDYYWKNREGWLERVRLARAKDGGKAHSSSEKKSRDKLRAETVAAYGGSCACCGEYHLVFLAIDHIEGGAKGEGSARLWRRLRAEGWPPGYQVLCHNCNWAKHMGVCPHKYEIA